MRYFLIDRVIVLEQDKRISAIKNVALSEDVFADHFFGNPVLPGAMQIEAIAQAATILLEVSSRFTRKAILVMVNNAKFRELVIPGDQLLIDLSVVSSDEHLVQLDATIRVRDKLVSSARVSCSLQPIDNFYPRETRHLLILLYANFLRGTELIGVTLPEGFYAK